MRCTLLNSLERHLSPLCCGLTSLCEPAKHQTRSLVWQRPWLMTLMKKWEERTKKRSRKSLSFFLSLLFCQDVGCSHLNLWIRSRQPRGYPLTSAIDTCSCAPTPSALDVPLLSSPAASFVLLHGSFNYGYLLFLRLIWNQWSVSFSSSIMDKQQEE